MTEPAQAKTPVQDSANSLEADIDAAVALCGGDVRAALRASLVANAYLQAEVERLSAAVSSGFARGRIRRPARPQNDKEKSG
jgi:hypothetical protein